ncbi:MAG TPA: MarC family protein [Chthoniobacterales bacterium]|nr:MarC family protein [Chthoniobacterales bacterium]
MDNPGVRDFTTKFLIAFIPIFVAIDAIGMVAIFIGLGANVEPKRRQQEALLGIGTALGISVGFMFLGKLIFQALGITVADFQVAGGLILLAFAVRDLLEMGGEKRPTTEAFGIVPLGMPLIAGPALLTALLVLTDSVGMIFTLVSLIVNLLIVAVVFRYADRLTKWMGKQGINGISKLVSLLLAAIAVSLIRRGWLGR